ncbi:MAG: amidohydrolase family protein [Gemmatimonadales bacterium]|nr:amidohydrolase family protein [Gemmatimonadales bacterium]
MTGAWWARAAVAAVAVLGVAAPLGAQAYEQLGPQAKAYVTVPEPVVALVGVSVVDGTGAPPKAEQTVLIERGVIRAVGPSASVAVPAGARRMELAGHTVLPGFVGMHDHTFYTTSLRSTQMNVTGPLLYLASGVTTIRTTGSMSPYSEINLKRNIEAGMVAGPRMHITGPYLTGAGAGGGMHALVTPEDARRVVAYWASEGASWLKFYTLVRKDVLAAAADEAHKRGLKVTGHLCSVGYRDAVDAGIDAVEHGLFANSEYDPAKEPDKCPAGFEAKYTTLDVNGPEVQRTFREMIRRKVAMTSTLAVYELFVPNRPPLEQRVLDAMSNDVRNEYLTTRARLAEPGAFAISPAVFRKAQEYEVAFVRAGGLLACGVDPTGNGGALPGFGDQRNYELLLEAGFTPVEAVKIMTANGAQVLGNARIGTVEAGKAADLQVIRGDPVARPAEIRNTTIVFKDGVGYDAPKMIAATKGLVGVR